MSESGTPLDAIESGDVANTADASRMANILRDMNASGAEIVGSQGAQQQQPPPPPMGMSRQPMPPMPAMPQNSMSNPLPPMYREQQEYVPLEEPAYVPTRKNVWGNLLGQLIDPLVVAVLVMALSLPALHTLAGKYASWAYVLGGQLSWFGLIVKSLLAATLFGLYKFGSSYLNA